MAAIGQIAAVPETVPIGLLSAICDVAERSPAKQLVAAGDAAAKWRGDCREARPRRTLISREAGNSRPAI
jgi:hypothetical protein